MIKEAYCSFEVSKLLKEKGFEGECIAYYSKYKDNNLNLYRWRNRQTYVNIRNNSYTLVPTHQMAMAWLREVYNIDIIIFHEKLPNDYYWARIECHPFTEFQQEPEYKTYEDAVEAALKYCLKKIIK